MIGDQCDKSLYGRDKVECGVETFSHNYFLSVTGKEHFSK